jgi:predicted kinase
MVKTLILTVGLPYSGKSTWAKSQNFPIVNRDSVRLALHGERFITVAEPAVSFITHYMVRALFIAGHDTVIVDECHNTQKRRDAWISDDWELELEIFDISKSECLARAYTNNDPVIIPIIERMAAEADYESFRN